MVEGYAGPLRDEPLAVELHNTLYASGGQAIDGLAEAASAAAWLTALQPRLPVAAGALPSPAELIELRQPVRAVLHALIESRPPDRDVLERLNAASERARYAPVASSGEGWPTAAVSYGTASRADRVLAAFAADALDIATGPRRHLLRACGAPGCVLMFIKDHPRREWCSAACGNRARQARHYARTRRPSDTGPA
jgi:predicted RNA-binding Zn ribbon-like protein